MKCYWKFKSFHSRKCIWKCHPEKWRLFCLCLHVSIASVSPWRIASRSEEIHNAQWMRCRVINWDSKDPQIESNRHRSDTFVSDRYLIGVDLRVLAILDIALWRNAISNVAATRCIFRQYGMSIVATQCLAWQSTAKTCWLKFFYIV